MIRVRAESPPLSPPLETPSRAPQGGEGLRQSAGTPSRRVETGRRENTAPHIREAAEGMEAMFLDYMMKVMRDSVPQESMGLDNNATKIYQSMMDSEMAQNAARAGSVGLADQIVAYLEAQSYTGNKGMAKAGQAPAGNTARSTSTGGTQ